ncbi:MAG: CRISPR-associated protein Cas4 [Candidatus Woesearchaeota archaeon]
MLVSVTSLSSYLYCKRKLFLQEVLGLKEPPKESLVLGLLRHNVFDSLNKSEQGVVLSIERPLSFDEVVSAYKERAQVREIVFSQKSRLEMFNIEPELVLSSLWSEVLDEISLRASNVFDFMLRTGLVGAELWMALSPKYFSEFRLESKKYSLKGVVDKVELHSDFCVAHELKSGSAARDGAWPNHRIQLASYMMMLEESLNVPASKGFIEYKASRQKVEVRLNPFMRDDVAALTKDVISLLSLRQIPERCTSSKKCDLCGIRDSCFDERKLRALVNTAG